MNFISLLDLSNGLLNLFFTSTRTTAKKQPLNKFVQKLLSYVPTYVSKIQAISILDLLVGKLCVCTVTLGSFDLFFSSKLDLYFGFFCEKSARFVAILQKHCRGSRTKSALNISHVTFNSKTFLVEIQVNRKPSLTFAHYRNVAINSFKVFQCSC